MTSDNEYSHDIAQDEIFAVLGTLGDSALITEKGLAALFGRHQHSVKRAVERGEIPRPMHLMKRPVWTIGSIREHLNIRMLEAQKDQKHLENLMKKHTATDGK